jgi:hypothetical protein
MSLSGCSGDFWWFAVVCSAAALDDEGAMRRKRTLSLVATAVALTAAAVAQPVAGAMAAPAGSEPTSPVIVVYRSGSSGLQSMALSKAAHVHNFSLVHAFSATVSQTQAASLAADPAVAAVYPDSRLNRRPQAPRAEAAATAKGKASQAVCPPAGRTMLAPEALPVTRTDSDDPHAKTARSLGFDGRGVKVAYIADDADPNNADFIRKDGSHVFSDYKDFTGEGPVATGGDTEAMLDASSIGAQGRVSHAIPTQPAGCDIRVEGVAPGASIVGLRAFPDNGFPTTSALVEAIDYAVTADHVNVLNESFGWNPFPDSASRDVTRLFNDMAVSRGVTVTASSGDAGTTDTIGSPSTDPKVISAGASTTFQAYAQGVRYGYAAFGATGWTDDNISALSSGGTTLGARTPDIVAPGDLNYIACDCTNGLGVSGGTSESAPLTAGAAALVIQAYRSTHRGATPSPALVKQIITSTADDLGHPAYEQGAGRLDVYKAVEAALSVHGGRAAGGKATGDTLLTDVNQLSATQRGGSKASWDVRVTNTGATAQTVRLSGRRLGAPRVVKRATVALSETTGRHTPVYNYTTIQIPVARGADRLDASIAYQTGPGNTARVSLFDPQGRYTAYSLPQGIGNHGHVDVRYPQAGTWTAYVFTLNKANGGSPATVKFQATTERYGSFGSVSPSVVRLAPGASRTVHVGATLPSAAGDTTASVVLNAGRGGQTSIPVTLRTLVNGSFSGTLTGGNGRQTNLGQAEFYQFDVKPGRHDIDASLALADDPRDTAVLFLINPLGQAAGFGTNRLATAYNQATGAGSVTPVLQATVYARDPMPGRWTLGVNFAGPTVGDEVSTGYRGAVQFDKVDVRVSGLPRGRTLKAGRPVTVKVRVRNTSAAPADFFVDPRLSSYRDLRVSAVQKATGVTLPIPSTAPLPSWLVPSETTAISVRANATKPVLFDFGPITGDPDVLSTVGTTAQGVLSGRPVTPGVWAANPALAGTFGSPAASASVDMGLTARTLGFDPAVTSPVSDLWHQAAQLTNSGLTLFTVQPGRTGEIPLTFTPAGHKGSWVKGTAFVDNLVIGDMPSWNAETFALPSDFASSLPYVANGSELAAFPYTYKIG